MFTLFLHFPSIIKRKNTTYAKCLFCVMIHKVWSQDGSCRGAVFTPNHQDNYDIPLVCAWMQPLDFVLIDRKSPRQSMAVMRRAALLEAGKSVIVFPKGEASHNHMGSTHVEITNLLPVETAGLARA